MNIIEIDFVEELKDEIKELNNSIDETDSQYLAHKFEHQADILQEVALPLINMAQYNTQMLTNCLHNKDRYISELLNEIRSLKGCD